MLDVTFFTISFRLQSYVGSVIRAIFFYDNSQWQQSAKRRFQLSKKPIDGQDENKKNG